MPFDLSHGSSNAYVHACRVHHLDVSVILLDMMKHLLQVLPIMPMCACAAVCVCVCVCVRVRVAEDPVFSIDSPSLIVRSTVVAIGDSAYLFAI